MNPLLVVATFEFRYYLRQTACLLFAALVFGQGIWYTYTSGDLYLARSSALQVYTILSSLGVALATVAVLLAGQSLTKDPAYKTTAYLYTLPITSRIYFAGRFLGTLSFALLLAIFYPLGMLLTLSISATPEPFSLIALADGFVWLVIPNVFICVSIAFSLTVFLRGVWGAYVCLFLTVLYFLLTDHQMGADVYADSWQLLDPFAVGIIRESIDEMPFFLDSDSLLSFSDVLIINRLLWSGLALGALARAESRFSVDTFAPKTPLQKPVAERSTPNIRILKKLPARRLQFAGWVPLQTTLRVAQLECQALIRQPIFQLTVGLLILLTLLLATVFNLNPDFPELPITSRMTALREPMGLFIGLFLLVITGELIFQERTVGFWPIFDALPQPDVVLLAGKLLALMSIATLLTVVLFLTGVGLQLSNGFSDIDWLLYRDDLLMDGFFRYVQLIILGACVAVFVNNRLVSHIINVLIFSLLTISYQANSPDQQRWLYSFLPGSMAYSDLIGYGSVAPLRLAFQGIWWGTAGLLLCPFLLTWNRGVSGNLRARIDHFRHQWNQRYALLVLGSFLLMGIGFWKLAQPTDIAHEFTSRYRTKTASFQSLSGQPVAITIMYHHPYQVPHMLLATKAALGKGEALFGAYPYSTIQIHEVPITQSGISSTPGNILISEKQGWIADNRQPAKLDYIDYLISREVFKQWLVHRLRPTHQPGDGFVRQSLAEYLALQIVADQYGSERLKQRLAQRTTLYVSGRNRSREPEIPALQSSGNDAVERGRAALALTSIGQVWGDAPLSLTISQFYQKALNKPTEATAGAFGQQLTSQLPDSLKYLTTYLSKPLWFDFKLGRIANLPNGLTVEIIPAKWQEDIPGVRHPLMSNDFIPLVILDRNGHEIYRQLVRPNPNQPFVSLPALPNAKAVFIDPLGAWPEQKKYDNYKLL